MADSSKQDAELRCLTDELADLRSKLKTARNEHTKDVERIARLERSVSLVEREIARVSLRAATGL